MNTRVPVLLGSEMMQNDSEDLEKRLFNKLLENNLPEKEVPKNEKFWFREIVIGFIEAGVNREDIKREYKPELAERLEETLKRTYRKMCELNFVDRWWYQKIMKKIISEKYGAYVSNLIKFIDYIVMVDDRVWIIEGKNKPSFEAIGQVLVYEDLFSKDYPGFEIRKGIICLEPDPLTEPTCKKLGISIFECASEEGA